MNFDHLAAYSGAGALYQKTAFQRLQEQTDSFLKPYAELQKVEDCWNPLRRRYEQYERLSGSWGSQTMKDLLAASPVNTVIRNALGADSAYERIRRTIELSAASSLPPSDISAILGAEAFKNASDIASRFKESFLHASAHDKFLEQAKTQALGAHFVPDYVRNLESAKSIYASLEGALTSSDPSKFGFSGSDFDVFVSAKDEVWNQVEEDISSFVSADAPDFDEFTAKVLAAIAAQPKQDIRIATWVVFLWVLQELVKPVITFYVTAALTAWGATSPPKTSPQQETKGIQEAVRATGISAVLLTDLRYVSISQLSVRSNPRSTSPELGKLRFGNPVVLVKTERDFALVEWQGHGDGTSIRGWVYSRYLKKFR